MNTLALNLLVGTFLLATGFTFGAITSELTDGEQTKPSDIRELRNWWKLGYSQALNDVSNETDDIILLRKLRKMEKESGSK